MEEFKLEELRDDETEAYEERRRLERRRRRMEMKRKKERQRKLRRIAKVLLPCVVILAVLIIGKAALTNKKPQESEPEPVKVYTSGQGDLEAEKQALSGEEMGKVPEEESPESGETPTAETTAFSSKDGDYSAAATGGTASVSGEVVSSYAILVDTQKGEIIAQRNPETVINPASMTKVLTVLVAAEHVTNLDDTFTITQEITDYSYRNDCSVVGWEVGEVVTVRDLFYGTVLPSGADAAVALAEYTAGSQEAFVEMMNDKLDELGLSSTAHFTNCVGLYDENHHCTVYDMAMILQAALDNPVCREALSAKKYTTSLTEQHPEGLLISNWFLRRIEDKDAGGEVFAGKTGYVVQSGSCAASCALDGEGNEYICVTADSTSSWRCIYDHVEIYKTFLPQSTAEESVSE